MRQGPRLTGVRQGPEIVVRPWGKPERLNDRRWRVTWRLEHPAAGAIEIHEAWLPHGRFRAETQQFAPPVRVAASNPADLSFEVVFDEAPGTAVENGFILLRTRWNGAPWRVFVRLTVRAGEQGEPLPVSENVTAQPIRFEG